MESSPKLRHRNRNGMDIVYEIISIANQGGCLKTHIMYRANLSYSEVKKYFDLLLDGGFLTSTKDVDNYRVPTEVYAVTEKALKWKSLYEQMRQLEADFPVILHPGTEGRHDKLTFGFN